MEKEQKAALGKIIAAAVLLAATFFIKDGSAVKAAVYVAAYLTVGYEVLAEAFEGIREREIFDENFLMAAATVGAMALGDFSEAVFVMLFYRVGELFEDMAVDRSRRNISALMDIRPERANIEEANGDIKTVTPEEVQPGDVIVVQPGEKVPVDGVVISGSTFMNTAALTGESVPRKAETGDEVLSGCINADGVIRVRAVKGYGESAVERILALMENAAEHKARSESFISKFAKVYTPTVCISALILAVLPPIVRLAMGHDAEFSMWIYRALSFLVISCPCALVMSIPLTFFAGLGGASRAGILIKGSNYMETLSKVDTVVFDKTGTVTEGVFKVCEIHHNGDNGEKLPDYAAAAECYSTHPIAKSIIAYYGKQPEKKRVQDVREISGHGVTAVIDGKNIAVGNAKLMEQQKVCFSQPETAGTAVHVAADGEYLGYLLISDVIKPEAAEAMTELRRQGIKKTVMLTGDSKAAAESVAEILKINEYRAELLPEDKVAVLEKLLDSEKGNEKLAFAGDGINDAPALTRSDVGIAMGAMGSDAAIEAADVVLMDDDPRKIAKAIGISRRTLRIVYENICFAIGVKVLFLLLSAVGLTTMWWAVFADVGVMVIAVLNAVRALNTKKV